MGLPTLPNFASYALTGGNTHTPPASTRGENMDRTPLVGSWRLVSFELRNQAGEVSYPFGPDVTGYLFYNADGYMSAAFMSAKRGAGPSEDLADAGAASTYDSFMAYCGEYEVEGDRIIHRVEVSSLAVWTGTVQERIFKIDGDRLTLMTAPLLIASETPIGHLVWDRVSSEIQVA